jgi:hypothetical protein
MVRLSLPALGLGMLLISGCATEEFVRKQTDPLAERLTALESRIGGIENKLKQPAAPAELSPADKAMLEKTSDTAQKAQNNADRADASAQKAEAFAKDAENSAKDAQLNAKKCEKMFELHQKK